MWIRYAIDYLKNIWMSQEDKNSKQVSKDETDKDKA